MTLFIHVTFKKKSTFSFLCFGCEGKRNASKEAHVFPSAPHFYCLIHTYNCQNCFLLSLTVMALTL